MWSFVRLERLFHDLRYAARMLARAPGFTAVAILSLAIGIGGNAAIFSLVDWLLVRPLPYFEPDRLVRITGIYPRAAVLFFQMQSRTMDVAAVGTGSEYNLTGQGEAIRIFGSVASTNLFSMLGAAVARGRAFEPGEDSPGRGNVVIISDSLWKHKFGGDPAIAGHAITLNGIQREIVGVMPPGFNFPSLEGGGLGSAAAGCFQFHRILGRRLGTARQQNSLRGKGSTGADGDSVFGHAVQENVPLPDGATGMPLRLRFRCNRIWLAIFAESCSSSFVRSA